MKKQPSFSSRPSQSGSAKFNAPAPNAGRGSPGQHDAVVGNQQTQQFIPGLQQFSAPVPDFSDLPDSSPTPSPSASHSPSSTPCQPPSACSFTHPSNLSAQLRAYSTGNFNAALEIVTLASQQLQEVAAALQGMGLDVPPSVNPKSVKPQATAEVHSPAQRQGAMPLSSNVVEAQSIREPQSLLVSEGTGEPQNPTVPENTEQPQSAREPHDAGEIRSYYFSASVLRHEQELLRKYHAKGLPDLLAELYKLLEGLVKVMRSTHTDARMRGHVLVSLGALLEQVSVLALRMSNLYSRVERTA